VFMLLDQGPATTDAIARALATAGHPPSVAVALSLLTAMGSRPPSSRVVRVHTAAEPRFHVWALEDIDGGNQP
jgi:hypothetical protein